MAQQRIETEPQAAAVTQRELEDCAALAREADLLREQMLRLRARMVSGTAGQGGEVRVPSTDPLGEAMARFTELEGRWMGVIARYTALALRADALIAEAADPYSRTVLRLRYLEGLPWEEVAERSGFVSRHCRRLANAALDALGVAR